MGQNFISCDRGQVWLLPPSLTDWLDEDHLVWTVLGAVDQMDLAASYGAYRANGQGRAAYDPRMMVCLLLYAPPGGAGVTPPSVRRGTRVVPARTVPRQRPGWLAPLPVRNEIAAHFRTASRSLLSRPA